MQKAGTATFPKKAVKKLGSKKLGQPLILNKQQIITSDNSPLVIL
jgi:hypothetical protein